jgi:hypothetical protein
MGILIQENACQDASAADDVFGRAVDQSCLVNQK